MPSRDVVYTPEIFAYIRNFAKREGDFGVVAEQDGQVVGVAWVRNMSAYHSTDDSALTLAVSVLPEFRGYGMGTQRMKKMLRLLQGQGCTQISLSVQKNNPAVRFYVRFGFQIK